MFEAIMSVPTLSIVIVSTTPMPPKTRQADPSDVPAGKFIEPSTAGSQAAVAMEACMVSNMTKRDTIKDLFMTFLLKKVLPITESPPTGRSFMRLIETLNASTRIYM